MRDFISRIKKEKSNVKRGSKWHMVKRNLIISLVALVLGGLLTALASGVDGFAQWYSTRIYPIWVTTVGRFFGWFPFSVAEILLYLLVLFIIGYLIYTLILMVKHKEKVVYILRWLTSVILMGSMLFFLFVTNAGINYHRDSFAQVTHLEVREYSLEELLAVGRWLTRRVNETGGLVTRDQDGVMILTVDLGGASREAMKGLASEFPVLEGYIPPPKPVLNSWILSIQQVAGIFSPFTIEGNFNSHMVSYNLPFVATHELVHVRGFMQEEEANFLAFLACIGSEEVEFQYSGYLRGWLYVRNALSRVDREATTELYHLLEEEVRADLRANREFWAQFEGPISELQTRVNDAYLRANAQPEGVRSYGMMVDLVIAYFLENYEVE